MMFNLLTLLPYVLDPLLIEFLYKFRRFASWATL